MATYTVQIIPSAMRALMGLPAQAQRSVRARIDKLADNPRPPGCKKLKGGGDEYRVRAGNYRVIYSIADAALLVTVVRIGDRKDIYD
jgi:mRNA interferase RelE/StbE